MTVVLIVAAVLIVLIFVGLFAAYHKVFYSPVKGMSETESANALGNHPFREKADALTQKVCEKPCEFVETRSFDGLKLSGRYYKGKDNMPLCICFHGYRGSAVRDFAGGGLYLMKQGYHVLLVDQRAHWRSGGHTITFGIRERRDVLTWVQFVNRRFGDDVPVRLFGISLGGGTVLMGSGQELPGNVKGIVADCPFNSPKDIICHVCRLIHLNPDVCWPIVWLSAHIYGHFNINETTAAKEAVKTKVPIMIIHGEGDNFVPMSMSKEVRDANPSMVEMHTFPKAGHGLSYLYDTERYERLVKEFMSKHS